MKDNPLLEEVEEGKEIAEAEESLAEEGKEEPHAETEQTPEVKGEGEGADDYDWESYLGSYDISSTYGQTFQDGEERPSFEDFLAKRTTLFDHPLATSASISLKKNR
jgi:RNA polymerase sigma-54 factor